MDQSTQLTRRAWGPCTTAVVTGSTGGPVNSAKQCISEQRQRIYYQQLLCCCAAATNGLRKYFRINGHIGESTSKDTLSFSSLEHQFESDLRKGYPEM